MSSGIQFLIEKKWYFTIGMFELESRVHIALFVPFKILLIYNIFPYHFFNAFICCRNCRFAYKISHILDLAGRILMVSFDMFFYHSYFL